ncbi:hypothetical protein K402DRAFT_349592 [Aulographum hederae CBS 113979]|uniref:Transcription initiation factor IIF subunit beta n=1 Tax=Aulographum hederae CBS 113979 TaxID=1176131 RepID=A0A6G1H9I4_9PEZI|nr:hypothetical protein K402DRAFT_349592 [Aulographum hederae CBS 113979]
MDEGPTVKSEPAIKSPDNMEDFEEYEDQNELAFPSKDSLQPGEGDVPGFYMLKASHHLWDAFYNIGDDDKVQIGEVRVYESQDGAPPRMTINLNDHPNFQNLDTEYDMQLTQAPLQSTYVFSEKDLPGYKPNPFGRNQGLRPGDGYRVQKGRSRVKRSIPKQTALLGYAKQEGTLVSMKTEDGSEIQRIEKRLEDKQKHRPKIKFVEVEDSRQLHQNFRRTEQSFSSFVKTSKPRPKAQDNKASRMDEKDLVQAIVKAFQEYEYWPLQSLKHRLRQPETWLKEVLSKVAVLQAHGQFNNKWRLSDDYKRNEGLLSQQAGQSVAPDVKAEDGEDFKAEDENFEDPEDFGEDEEEMEDVL